MMVMEVLIQLLLQVASFCQAVASEENIDLSIHVSDPNLLEKNERPVRQMPGSNDPHLNAYSHPNISPQVEHGLTNFYPSAQSHPATGYGMPGIQPYPGSEYLIPGAQPYPGAVYPSPGAQPYPGAAYPSPGAQPYPGAAYPSPGVQPYPGAAYPSPGAQPYPDAVYPSPGAQPYPPSGYGPPVEQPHPAATFADAPPYAPDSGYGSVPQYVPYPAPQYAPDAGYAPVPQYAPIYPGEPAYAPAPQYVPAAAYPPSLVAAPAPIYAHGYIPAPAVQPRVPVMQVRYVPGAAYRQLICGQKVTCGYRIVTKPGSYVYYRTYVYMPAPAPVPPRVVYTCPQQTCIQQRAVGGCGYVQPVGPAACTTHQGCQIGQQCCYNPTSTGLVCGQGIATALRARRHMQIESPMSGPSRIELLIGQWRDSNVTSLLTQWLLPLKMDLEDFIEISFSTRTKCCDRGIDCISSKVLNCIIDIEEHAFNNTRTSPEHEESRRATREALFSDLSMKYDGNSPEFFESNSSVDWLQRHDEFLDTLHEGYYYQNVFQRHKASGVTSDNEANNIDNIFQPDWENLSQRNYSSYAEHQDQASEAVNQWKLLQEAPEKEDQRLFHQGVAPEAVHRGLEPEAVSPGLLHQGLTPEAVHQGVLPQGLTPEIVDQRLSPQSASPAHEKQVRLLSFASCLLQSVQTGVEERKKSALLTAKRCVRAYGYDWQRVRHCTAQDDAHHEGGDEGMDLDGAPVKVTVNQVPIRAEGNLELSLCYTLNKFGIEPVLCDILYDSLEEQRERKNGPSGNGEENGASLQTENVLVGDSSGLETADIAGYTINRYKTSNEEIIVPIYRKDST